MPNTSSSPETVHHRSSPTYFFLRGLAIILPPVLTLLILLWVANGFNSYVIQPINLVVRYVMAQVHNDIRTRSQLVIPGDNFPKIPDWHHNYLITPELRDYFQKKEVDVETLSDKWAREVYVPMGKGDKPNQCVPWSDYDFVFNQLRPQPIPTSAIGVYMEIAAVRDFRTSWQLSAVGLSITIIALYFLGRFVTARIGKWFVLRFEWILVRVPLVRNVYSTVKQVTDFVLSDKEVEFQRVVALEYPRAESWTLGFVTGEGMLECAAEVGEPMVTVLVPTSPMPMGGFTLMIPKSKVIDLNLTVDQALQFIVSCGVLTPPQQRTTPESLEQELQKRLARPQLVPVAGPAAENAGSSQN